MKTQIKAEIVAHSINEQGDELISVMATFPRIILAEVNTHRMLSKNTSSSRAIPFNKMVETVQNDPFIPIAWQKEHKGMQGTEYFTNKKDIAANEKMWLHARDYAIQSAVAASRNFGITKQLCNRLLEPFMWTTMLITGSKEGWDNFFHLRCPSYQLGENFYKSKKDWKKALEQSLNIENSDDKTSLFWLRMNKGQAEIHMMDLAEKIYDAVNESTPKQLQAGEWHIPFEDKISSNVLDWSDDIKVQAELLGRDLSMHKVKVSTAMAARTSYTVVGEEKALDYEALIGLHDRLISQDPPHSSPLEHCAKAMSDEQYYMNVKGFLPNKVDEEGFIEIEDNHYSNFDCFGWCYNLKGFIPYRYLVDNNLSI